ncbi:MAG: hypothetical protein QNJ14_10015 [Woeseiaceae bacterium]|nr:hypothetical protein [Woeseiaceae bacterium]
MANSTKREPKESSSNLQAVPSSKNTCHIFISRKTTDAHILGRRTANREKLLAWANDKLTIFDAALIEPGNLWRSRIREEIERADILLLVVTRPSQRDFDWPLYEAGLFDSLQGNRHLICIYPEGSKPPDQLADIQGVEATEANILDLLTKLFEDASFTNTSEPLSPKVPKAFDEELRAIAKETYQDISGVRDSSACEVQYLNPYLQLRLQPGAKRLTPDTEIKSNMRSLRTLFKLRKRPPDREFWSWHDIEKAVDIGDDDPMDFNVQWMREAEEVINKMLAGKAEDRQISDRYIARDKRVWTPEIEIWRAYDDGRRTIDITFSPDTRDEWLKKARAPVALAANLNLAVRIRHDVIETYLRRLPHWRDAKKDRFEELESMLLAIERDGFFIRWLTSEPWAEAFDFEDADRVADLEMEYHKDVRPKLFKSIKDCDVMKTVKALRLWRNNNAEFLKVAIPRYTKLLRLES